MSDSNPRTCTKLSAEGTTSQVVCENLKDFQHHVGGPIEIVSLFSSNGHRYQNTVMLVNEEGMLKGTTLINALASVLANQIIVGDVLIVPKSFLN